MSASGPPGACIIKLITAVMYGFRNKLVFVPIHYTRLERLAMDKHSSLLRKPQITAVISFMIQGPGRLLVVARQGNRTEPEVASLTVPLP